MQAITISIGKAGILFFAQQYLVDSIHKLLGQVTPPNRTIPIPDFGWIEGPESTWGYTNISVALTNGSLSNFSPAFQSVVQGVSSATPPVPIFTLNFQANNFSALYNWLETYAWSHNWVTWMGRIPTHHHKTGNSSTPLSYNPEIGGLGISVIVEFLYNSTTNAWQVQVNSTSTQQPTGVQANIPTNSILQNQDNSCAGQHVSDATAQMISNIDFATPINSLISGILATIPGSGNLGNNILYDFSLGDSGLLFPNNDGIQMGVKGGASYNGTAFSGDTPPSLPLPAPLADTDTHHLNMYVSNYEVDALNWAFFQAGKLNTVVNAADLPDPDVLKVKTYVNSAPQLKPYTTRAMQAQIQPSSAPTTAFQLVYELSAAVMQTLSGQLPTDVYNNLTGLQGNNYVSTAALESDLSASGIPTTYYQTIEKAAQSMGMVVSHDINYTLTILDFQPTQPTIEFTVQRVDILSGLSLGTGGANNTAQTLQFAFANVSWVENFVSSNIPGLNAGIFDSLWLNAGEPQYAALMQDLGKNGVPLPIMQGFEFDFTNAELSIQENYLSILANVQFNSAQAIQSNI